METIELVKIDEVYMRIKTDPSIKEEIKTYFAFRPEGYKFSPKFKNKVWDGYIYLYSPFKNLLYLGLVHYMQKFCKDRGYKLVIDPSITICEKVEDDYGYQLAEMFNTPFKPHYYQNDYIIDALRRDRATLISPTSSGKSFIIYLMSMHYRTTQQSKCLVIVPTVSLVHQMVGDCVDYGGDVNDYHKIMSGADKDTNKPVVVSTWQSIAKMPKSWFEQFDVVFGDEAHNFAAKSLKSLMEKMVLCRYRFGLTGTLKGSKVHKLVLEGLFGPVIQHVTTKKLMDEGTVAKLDIKCLVLNYHKNDKSTLMKLKKKEMPNKRFHAERDFINAHDTRNNFIRKLLWSLEGKNNLILFDQVQKHGRILEPMLRNNKSQLHFVHGGKDSDDKEAIRAICEASFGNNILASTGVFSTGISIKRLDNLIFVGGGKSQIKVLQSLGRLLRKGNGSDEVQLFDLIDSLPYGGKPNYFLTHGMERVKMYNTEQHNYKLIELDFAA